MKQYFCNGKNDVCTNIDLCGDNCKFYDNTGGKWIDAEIDVVEVVRCKNCKYWWKENELCVHKKCVTGMIAVVEAKADHFCGYGEKK